MTSTCQRCGRSMDPSSDFIEYQEALIISFRAGYGSLFGDGNLVESTLCQHCINELLGPWLRIVQDDPFAPRHRLYHPPQGAYQPNQLMRRHGAMPVSSQDELRRLFVNPSNDDT